MMKYLISFCLTAITFLPTVNAQDTIQSPAADTTKTSSPDTTRTAVPDTIRTTLPDTTVQMSASVLFPKTASNYAASDKSASPYTVTFKRDVPVIAAGIGLTLLGTRLIGKKDHLTDLQLRAKTRDKVPFFDRGNAGYYSTKADDASYVPFYFSFGWPVVMALINKKERHDIGRVLTLYLETMAVTGAAFTMAAGTVYRSRPLVYGTIADVARRKDNDSQRSFFAGHTAATAAATFFTAKVFQDYNPDSKLKTVVWVVAAATPALVGYWRYKAGMHFLSDNLLGYAVGAGAGILIPQWHKSKRSENMTIVPEVGNGYKGLAITYKF
jgi:membrane-associated phospholipid phosphatase